MSRQTPRSPQEKKALSLEKDRRNAYRANDKASRKSIPLRKAKENRRNRHKNNQALAAIEQLDDGSAAVVESSARQDIHRAGGWKKGGDQALADHISSQLLRRDRRVGRKASKRID